MGDSSEQEFGVGDSPELGLGMGGSSEPGLGVRDSSEPGFGQRVPAAGALEQSWMSLGSDGRFGFKAPRGWFVLSRLLELW